jgi:hypothetical protein
LTAKYYVHVKYRVFRDTKLEDLTFIIKYRDTISIEYMQDFFNICREYLEKKKPNVIDCMVMSWVKLG